MLEWQGDWQVLGERQGTRMNRYTPNYVVFDLETTGISPKYDEVVEISAVKVRGGVVAEEFSTLVNPGRSIPYGASQVNGITDDMVADAPPFSRVLMEFLEFIGEDVLVGHNIHHFDMKFIYRDCERFYGQVPDNNYVDTLLVARQCLPQLAHHHLVDLSSYYGISTKGAHRALNDCHMNQQVYEKIVQGIREAKSAGGTAGGKSSSFAVPENPAAGGKAEQSRPVHTTIRIRGIVERITYQNPENGYTVLKCAVKNYADLVTVVGSLLDANVGSVLLMNGNWKVDARYGRQFMAETWEETMPATIYGIEKYLGSGLIKGVGPKFAKKIVQKFGTETIEVIETDVQRLREVDGIGMKRIQKIQESWEKQKEIKNIMLFLQDHGVSTAFAAKIYRAYGNESIEKVKENPFRLADDIWGIGFKTADGIAEKLGFGKESYVRLRSGIMYTLSELADQGHVYAVREQLIHEAARLLEAGEEYIVMTLDQMIRDQDLMREIIPSVPEVDAYGMPRMTGPDAEGTAQETCEAIYLPPFYYAECGTARKLRRLLAAPAGDRLWNQLLQARAKTGNPELSIDIERIQASVHMEYDEIQAEAIRQAAVAKVMVLTGGPGTGKTTTVQGIIAAYRSFGLQILLAAPTGRAAKRMTEATGLPAKTIHRLLDCKPPEGYQKNEENPLEGDVLIIDECSMLDIVLMNALLRAMPEGMRLILVGDIDQLPSVGAGNVLRDIIDSGCVPVIRLTRIFRQAQSSRIIMNAHRINRGEMPNLSNGRHTDFFFMEQEDPEQAVPMIVELVRKKLPVYYQTPAAQIQVLTPMQRGVIGAAALNLALQEALNPEGDGLRRGGYLFRTGDKVMQVRNNYDKEVFNGDIGIVCSVDIGERLLKVDYDGNVVSYDVSELDELVHAYATTIHKAQGSEYPIVVMPVMMSHYVMLQRNLIYTGITRAKKILVLVGTRKAIAYAVGHVTVTKRNTYLAERLRDPSPASS